MTDDQTSSSDRHDMAIARHSFTDDQRRLPMGFNQALAAQNARTLTREELDLVILVVCSALNSRYFHGVQTVHDARDMIDILAHEQYRRDDHDAIAHTGT